MRRFEDEEVGLGEGREQAYSLGRILAISDGVFAFALTLLVVQLSVPDLGSHDSLGSRLLEQTPTYFSYALSFAVIATTWYGHHSNFKYIRRSDGWLVALNFGSLLLIAILPFPTAVLGHNGHDPVAAVIYAVTIALTGLFGAAVWWHATHRRRLVRSDLQDRVVRLRTYRTLTVPTVFLISIPIAAWRPEVAEIGWTVIWVLYFAFLHRYLDRIP